MATVPTSTPGEGKEVGETTTLGRYINKQDSRRVDRSVQKRARKGDKSSIRYLRAGRKRSRGKSR